MSLQPFLQEARVGSSDALDRKDVVSDDVADLSAVRSPNFRQEHVIPARGKQRFNGYQILERLGYRYEPFALGVDANEGDRRRG